MTGTTLATKPAVHRGLLGESPLYHGVLGSSPLHRGPLGASPLRRGLLGASLLHLGPHRLGPLATMPQATRAAHKRSIRRGRGRRSLTEHLSLALSRIGDRERGDVPGWVLITLMTAGLVVALWAIAGNVLTEMFESALKSVKGP